VHLQAFTPLMTGITLGVVCAICARGHHQASDDSDTFTISPVVGYMMVCVGLIICAVPLLPGAAGDIPKTRFLWYLSPFWLLAFTAAAFLFRYRVVVRDQTLTFGAFRRRVVPFSDVIDLDVIEGSKSSELWVYLRSGHKIKLSDVIGDFDELVGMVNSQMAGMLGPQHDSAAKIRDRKNRKQEGKTVAWLIPVALGIVALVVFVLWRMQLLH
jgi:hypothetical protein